MIVEHREMLGADDASTKSRVKGWMLAGKETVQITVVKG